MNEPEQEMQAEFLLEAWEQLECMDRELLALEEQPHTSDARITNIFRNVHTLKGGAGFLGLEVLESVAHYAESLLSRMRSGELHSTRQRTDLLLRSADGLRRLLTQLDKTGDEAGVDCEDLRNELKAASTASADRPADERDAQRRELEELQSVLFAALDEAPAPPPASAVEEPAENPGVTDSRIRVHVDLLDKLMNLVGELVLSRNQILQVAGAIENSALMSACQRINLVTSELQEHIMQTRMQPVSTVLNRFPRIVRDLAAQTGKEIRFTMDGQDTGLDRTILEAIRDPLTHILRNSVDHGLEKPEPRIEKGKPPRGTIHVRAYHEGGQVTIEVHDDGAGINLDRVRAKALEQRLIDEQEAAAMSERDTLHLIFRPGFSTAQEITNLSGRGVGMDVVRTCVERIGGTVDLATRAGHGTTVKLRIPLTLAIIPALLVTTAGERYAIPQVSLQELVRLEGSEARRSIERLYGAEVYRLRGELLPLLRLRSVLGLPRLDDDVVNIVVVSADGSPFGLIVDSVLDTEEIVVKPLSRELKQLQLYAGATIMGDGRVALILDVAGLARSAGLNLPVTESTHGPEEEAAAAGGGAQAMLLFTLGEEDEQFAIPLALLSRLEEFAPAHVERLGRNQVVQYRGRLLPLLDLAEEMGQSPRYGSDQLLQVLVFSNEGRELGLCVARILDVVEENLELSSVAARHGVEGTAIVRGRATTIINLHDLLGERVGSY